MKLDVGMEHGYNIATALRGPDNRNHQFKYEITSTLRYFAGCGQYFGTMNSELEIEAIIQDKTKVRMSKSLQHVMEHAGAALSSMKKARVKNKALLERYIQWFNKNFPGYAA